MNWQLFSVALGMALPMAGAGLGSAWWIIATIWKLDTRLVAVETALRLAAPKPSPAHADMPRIGRHRDFGKL